MKHSHIFSGRQNGGLIAELFTRHGVGTSVAGSALMSIPQAQTGDIPDITALIRPLEEQGILRHRSREYLENHIGGFSVLEHDRCIYGCRPQNLCHHRHRRIGLPGGFSRSPRQRLRRAAARTPDRASPQPQHPYPLRPLHPHRRVVSRTRLSDGLMRIAAARTPERIPRKRLPIESVCLSHRHRRLRPSETLPFTPLRPTGPPCGNGAPY